MIAAQELRIGNWVYSSRIDGFCKVIRLDHEKEVDADPVPLTPEILEKAKETLTSNGFTLKCTKTKRLEISVGYSYLTTVDYLHEYQNFYFALTGTELQISL